MLPLFLPTSTIDLETDIALGLEELRIRRQVEERLRKEQGLYSFYGDSEETLNMGDDTYYPQVEFPRALRSRWSMSTLSTVRNEPVFSSSGASAKIKSYIVKSSIAVKRRVSNQNVAESGYRTSLSPPKKFRRPLRASDITIVRYDEEGVASIQDSSGEESEDSSGSSSPRRKPVKAFLKNFHRY